MWRPSHNPRRISPTHLQEKVAVVTGADPGCKRVSAELFTLEGDSATLVDVDCNAVDVVINAIIGADGRAVAVQADVSKEENISWFVRTAVEEFGKLDIPVNNAAINVHGNVEGTSRIIQNAMR